MNSIAKWGLALGVLAALGYAGDRVWRADYARNVQAGIYVSAHAAAVMARTIGPPAPTARLNAALKQVTLKVLDARVLENTPTRHADGTRFNGVGADVEVQITNHGTAPLTLSSQANFQVGCAPWLATGNSGAYPEAFLPIQDSLFAITARQLKVEEAPGTNLQQAVFVTVPAHGTKTGWLSAFYITNCGRAPNVIEITDDWTYLGGGGVQLVAPYRLSGPPISTGYSSGP